MAEKRTKLIPIRVTPDEYAALQERKTRARLAEWMRMLALDQAPPKPPRAVDPALLYEINRIGINLNQIAKSCASAKGSPDLIRVALALREIEGHLSEVLDRAG